MLLNQASVESIQRYCLHNRALLDESSTARCVHCGASFAPREIDQWASAETRAAPDAPQDTACCPKCGDRSVLPSAAPIMLTAPQLEALRRFWFSGKH